MLRPLLLPLVFFVASCSDAASQVLDEGDAGPSTFETEFEGPALLSETGLYADIEAREVAPGIERHDVRFELWSDGSEKKRWISIPEGETIDKTNPDRWIFPIGTRVWKEFQFDGELVETRMLHKKNANTWEGVAYVWDEEGEDAEARPTGLQDARGTSLDVPSTDDCSNCHRGATDVLLGFGAIQNVDEEAFIPGDEMDIAALGYLHANCGHCHNDVHPLGAQRTLRFYLPSGLATLADAPVMQTAVNAEMHHRIDETVLGIVPGDPEMSQVWRRIQHRNDGYAMPPMGSEQIDTSGVTLLEDWISGLLP